MREWWSEFPHLREEKMDRLLDKNIVSNEEDLLTHEVSDEALEAAGAYEVAANFTLAACTNNWYCAA